MRVRIHDLNKNFVYVATEEADCKDDTDRSVFREVLATEETITMGKVIGEPVPDSFKEGRSRFYFESPCPICGRWTRQSKNTKTGNVKCTVCKTYLK